MLSSFEVWNTIEQAVRESGLELFDLELPTARSKIVRVFICRRKNGGVNVDECAQVSKKISNLPNIESIFPGECVIEVSSPGINRRLRRPEHFSNAIGERVRVVVENNFFGGTVTKETASKGGLIRGMLVSFDGLQLEVQDEISGKKVDIPFGGIREARVDFLFPKA